MRRKNAIIFSILLYTVLFTACGGSGAVQKQEPIQAENTGGDEEVSFPTAIAKAPVLLTSGGQSADVRVTEVLLEKGGVDCDMDAVAEAEELDGYETLILALGGSTKGLAATGIEPEEEVERIQQLVSAAKEREMTVIVLHIGGSSRRGNVSDRFVPDALAAADAALILREGDGDGMMKAIIGEHEIPALYVDSQAEVIEPLAALFE